MYYYFEKDIRNLRTEGIKSIQITNDMVEGVMYVIKYDKHGYPVFIEHRGLFGEKYHYELCMCRNYYKNDMLSRRIVAKSGEDVFLQYNYVYENDVLICTEEYVIGTKLMLNSTTDYTYIDGKLTAIDTTYNGNGYPEHISIEYNNHNTILICDDGIESIGKTDDGKLVHYTQYQPLETRYDFIYENNHCIGIKSGYGFYMELVIKR